MTDLATMPPTAKVRRGERTRAALMDAVEAWADEYQLDLLDARSAGRLAGQGNNSVVQYHFGGLWGLIEATLRRKIALVDHSNQSRVIEGVYADRGYARLVASALTSPSYRPHALAMYSGELHPEAWAALVVAAASLPVHDGIALVLGRTTADLHATLGSAR